MLPVLLIGLLAVGYHFGWIAPLENLLSTEALTFTLGGRSFTVFLVIKAIVALILLAALARLLVEFGEGRIRALGAVNASNRELVIKAFQIGAYTLTFFVALEVIGVDITTFAVVGGAIGIGLGFGLQKIASNFISGLILLMEKSIEEDDLVELENGTMGFVRKTGARYTLIETFENRELMVPNENFITSQVTNWTFSNTLGRIDIDIGVSYGSDLEQVQALMLEAALEHPRCSSEPEPQCYLVDFAESSVNFRLYFWVADVVEGRLRPASDVRFSIWRKFQDNGITIPFPQRDLHIRSE